MQTHVYQWIVLLWVISFMNSAKIHNASLTFWWHSFHIIKKFSITFTNYPKFCSNCQYTKVLSWKHSWHDNSPKISGVGHSSPSGSHFSTENKVNASSWVSKSPITCFVNDKWPVSIENTYCWNHQVLYLGNWENKTCTTLHFFQSCITLHIQENH